MIQDKTDGLTDIDPKFIFSLRIINTFIERLKWFILFFFIFEMAEVRIKLMSQSVLHFDGLMHSLKGEQRNVYIISIILSLYILVINILRYYNEDIRENYNGNDVSEPWNTFAVAVRFIKTLVDTYMFVLFF